MIADLSQGRTPRQIIGKDGASACAPLVERTTRYLIIVALPLGCRADQVCDALTRRIQGLLEGAMRTLTWDQGLEMARHQRITPDTGVELFFTHPYRSIQPTHCYHPLTPPPAKLPQQVQQRT